MENQKEEKPIDPTNESNSMDRYRIDLHGQTADEFFTKAFEKARIDQAKRRKQPTKVRPFFKAFR